MTFLRIFIYLILILGVAEQAPAGVPVALSRHNDDIDATLRGEMADVNERLIESIRDNDPSVMLDVFMQEIRDRNKTEKGLETLYAQLGKHIGDKPIHLLHEFHVTTQAIDKGIVSIAAETPHPFIMQVEAMSDEMYISLYVVEGPMRDLMLGFIHMKVDGRWQLHGFHTGSYTVAGKTAFDWIREGKEFLEKGQSLPAALRLQIASTCIRPVPFMKYEEEAGYLELAEGVKKAVEGRFQFPGKLTEVESAPELYSIQYHFLEGSLMPLVNYITTYSLDDQKTLQDEVNAMTPVLVDIFPGIDQGTRFILYNIFTERPLDPTHRKYESRGIGVKVGEKVELIRPQT
ncbi:MAG: hypothetical protein Q8R76_07815 [Candidatus Omnitrophota bacterium]|nr:hypothetical protein [Candidatus Omnitrophota bacterium]